MEQIKQIYPNQHKEREKTEKKSGVYDLPLPPTPPKCVNPFLSMQDDEIGASGGGIVMQMPTGQMVVMPLLPSTGICKYIEISSRCYSYALFISNSFNS